VQTRAAERDSTKRLDVLASYITLSSIVYYAVVIALLHILRSDFNPGYRYLSEYARGPYGALMTSTFFVLSAGSLALLLGLCRSVTSRVHFVPGLVLWFAWACAVFLAGIYTSDLQGTPHTRIGRIHDQMGMIAFPSATVALLLLSLALRWEREWRSVWRPAMLLSVVVFVSFLVLDRFGEKDLGGLDQRIFLGATLIWMWIIGKRIQVIARVGGVPTS
jgi:Protein of unknown function (DUF998)